MPPLETRQGGPGHGATLLAPPEVAPETLHGIFRRTAALHPDAIAIEVPPGSGRPERRRYTYTEIAARAHALAGRLAPLVRRDAVVAIVLPRDRADMYVAQIGIMESGAAYTCIEPGLVAERARYLIEDCDPVAVITSPGLRAHVESLGVPASRVLVMDDEPAPPGLPSTNGFHVTPESLAYVIYTSGTSGRPKGVMVEHRSIVTLIWSNIAHFGLGPADRCAQSSSCSYDSSIDEAWLAFATGATMIVMDDDAVRLGPDMVEWLARERVTVFCPPPTLLRMTACEDPERALPELRLLYVGGEELPPDVADRWAPGRRLENGYGPTECAVVITRATVRAGEPVRIGWPVAGNVAHVLDDQLNPVPDGTPGELCIHGPSVARGYLGRPELTAERFVLHPALGRIYRTGDLVRRDPDGGLTYLGRSDSQVKIRGHRVELGEIEAQLCRVAGIQAAACTLQGDTARRELAAFLVSDGSGPPDLDAVRAHARATLPEHMRPAHYAVVTSLPTRDNSGKLDRSALPVLRRAAPPPGRGVAAPRGPIEAAVAAAVREHVPYEGTPGPDDDFFLDLGGTSLVAAQVISTLRRNPLTASLTVRDLYETRTISALAARATPADSEPAAAVAPSPVPAPASGWRALPMYAWVAVSLVAVTSVAWWAFARALPALEGALGPVPVLLLLPGLVLVAELAWLPVVVALTVAAKRLLIGRYAEGRHPHLGGFHVRHWIVVQLARAIPWPLVSGTELQNAILRALGARIGRRVHIHAGVDLAHGGWDLLVIGDDVTIGRDAGLGMVDWHDRQLVLAPVTLESGATLDTRAQVSGGARIARDGFLGPLALLVAGRTLASGERWDGVPASHTGPAPDPAAAGGEWSASRHAMTLVAARMLAQWAAWLPMMAFAALALRPGAGGTGFLPAPLGALPLPLAPLVLVAGYAAAMPVLALVGRLAGRVPEGDHPLRGRFGVALALKDGLVETANGALSGTLMWPWWLRLAGARIGARCEISTVMEVVPELLEVGDECFCADGIYLGRPLLHRGIARCRRTVLANRTFIGNHAVIPGGERLPEDILLGICTVADASVVRPGTSWFGNPMFELPRRETSEPERGATFAPTWDRLATRIVFESLRAVLPLLPLALVIVAWNIAAGWSRDASAARFVLLLLPGLGAAIGATLVLGALFVKWFVMGPIRESRHPLWSCWCCRWDILYETWSGWAMPVIWAFEGTPLVSAWLRAMGCRIGRGVVFGSSFLQVVDPDMLHVGDGATVSCHIQSHSFEDRVLKLAPVHIRAGANVGHGAVLLYGADIGAGAEVADNSIVMKHETLLPGLRYVGFPTRSAGPVR